jgi:hypothetical protein
MTDGERYISPNKVMSIYDTDKERIDKIEYKIMHREPLKEWVAFYWIAVAIGHILEWIVKHGKEFRDS